jgi:hypothetical protein
VSDILQALLGIAAVIFSLCAGVALIGFAANQGKKDK